MNGVGKLPPKPDPATGEPRPPHAPVYGTPVGRDGHDTKAAKPAPPAGYGPALEWYVERNKNAFLTGTAALGILLGAMVVLRGFTWMQYWQVWLMLAGGGAVIWWLAHGSHYEAGADWFRHRGWVNSYRLHEIELNVLEGSVSLTLQDDLGGALSIDVQELQAEQRMWDLVYNGMRHSVANGTTAEVNSYARTAFKLPSPNPTAESRARYEELKTARRHKPRRRWPIVVLHVLGWPLLAIALIDVVKGLHGDETLGVLVLGGAGALLVGAGTWLALHRR